MVTKGKDSNLNLSQKPYLENLLEPQEFSQVHLKSISKDREVFQPTTSFLFVGRWFRFGVVLFLLLSVVFGTAGCSPNKATTPWAAAAQIVPVETVQAVIRENSELNPQQAVSNLIARAVDTKAGKLIVFNFSNSGVCGHQGCLYVAYLIKKEAAPIRVFSSYLNPNLPPNRLLLQVADDVTKNSALPCLQIQQPSGNEIRQLTLCFNGREYQLTKSSLIEARDK